MSWQHQQQQDEQERLEEIQFLIGRGYGGILLVSGQHQADEWRKEIEAAIGLTKKHETEIPPESKPF